MYGAILMGCNNHDDTQVSYNKHPNKTSWYFDTPLMKHLRFQ